MTTKNPYPLPNPADPTGLTARPVFDPTNPGKYAGQDRNGQSSIAGVKQIETYSQVKYGRSPTPVVAAPKHESSPAPAPAAAEETTKDIPKTG